LLKQDEIAMDVKDQGFTALESAAAMGYNDLLSVFKARKPQAYDTTSCFALAIRYDRVQTAQMLLTEGGFSSIDFSFPSSIASLSDASDDMIKLLLLFKAPVHLMGAWHILREVCRFEKIGLIRRLVSLAVGDESYMPYDTGRTPLEIAADAGSIDIATILVASSRSELRCITFNTMNKDSILAKVEKYDDRILEILVMADLDQATKSTTTADGATLLHHAVHAGKVELVQRLLKNGGDVNAGLRRFPPYWALTYDIEPASASPWRMALELNPHKRMDGNKPLFLNGWNAERFASMVEAVMADDRIDLSSLSCKEGLQYLLFAALLGSEHQKGRVTLSLIKRNLLFSWGAAYCKDSVAQLMIALRKHTESLMAVAHDKNLLWDTLTRLMQWTQ
jgi:ankyrin repeat protein